MMQFCSREECEGCVFCNTHQDLVDRLSFSVGLVVKSGLILNAKVCYLLIIIYGIILPSMLQATGNLNC